MLSLNAGYVQRKYTEKTINLTFKVATHLKTVMICHLLGKSGFPHFFGRLDALATSHCIPTQHQLFLDQLEGCGTAT